MKISLAKTAALDLNKYIIKQSDKTFFISLVLKKRYRVTNSSKSALAKKSSNTIFSFALQASHRRRTTERCHE
jgi:hypothetical protein